jgi:NitT/TauT family transport system ATP-binding protein
MKLSLTNVNKVFKSGAEMIEVFHDINLEVKSGEFVCIVGPSGCGKSTLINIIAGLEKVTAGKVEYNSKEISTPSPERALIFQDAALLPWLTVIDNVELGLKIAGIPKTERREKATYYLDMVHLNDFYKYYTHQLSGGMRQRVAIARALSLESKILLMDEPFAALDSQTKDILHLELLRIWKETKKTIIFITHNIDEAVLLADRIIVMSPRPATIKKEIPLMLERPRKMNQEVCQIIDMIKRELQWCEEGYNVRKQDLEKGNVLSGISSFVGDNL